MAARITRLIALALLAVAFASCGADDEETATPQRGTETSAPTSSSTPSAARSPEAETDGPATEERGGDGNDGDGDGSETVSTERSEPEPPRQSLASYVEDADAICADAQKRARQLGDELGRLTDRASHGKVRAATYYRRAAALTAQIARIGDGALEQLRALPRPNARRESLRRYLELAARQTTLFRRQAAAFRARKPRAVNRLNRRRLIAAAKAVGVAARVGLRVCGRGR